MNTYPADQPVAILSPIIVYVLFCVLLIVILRGPLKAIPAEYRKLKPSTLWYALIPGAVIFFWFFVTLYAIPASYKNYFQKNPGQDKTNSKWYGLNYALVWHGLSVINLVDRGVGHFIPFVGLLNAAGLIAMAYYFYLVYSWRKFVVVK